MSTLSQFYGSSGSSSGSAVRSACIESFGDGAYEVYYTNGTFTVPSGVTSIRVKVYGAGGASAWGFGGGGGGFTMGCLSVTPGQSYNVCVGRGGCQLFAGSLSGAFCNPCYYRGCEDFCIAPTNSSFHGCFTATPGENSSLKVCLTCCYNGCTNSYILPCCSYCIQCWNCGGSGSGGSVNYTGGAGACFNHLCSNCVCTRTLSWAGGAIAGGGSAATQCGNGYAGFHFCRNFPCHTPMLYDAVIGGAGALGGNIYFHQCCRYSGLSCCISGCECCVRQKCVADGWGAQSSLDTVKTDSKFSAMYNSSTTCNTGTLEFGNYDRAYKAWAERSTQNFDNPDVPVPGEYLNGHGGKSVDVGGDYYDITRVLPDVTTTCLQCCAAVFPYGGAYGTHIEVFAGNGGPGAGGGAARSVDIACFKRSEPVCSGCCKHDYTTTFHIYGGNGGFAGGGGGVHAPWPTNCYPSSVLCCRTYLDLKTGRGGIGGGSGGYTGWALLNACCFINNGGKYHIEAEGGNGLVVVEY